MDAETQAVLVATLFALWVYAAATRQFFAKRARNRVEERATRYELFYRSHRCPDPGIRTVLVEKQHDPWVPQPWMRVDTLEEVEVCEAA